MTLQKDDQRASYLLSKSRRHGDRLDPTIRPSIAWVLSFLALALAYFLQKLVWPLIPASPFLLFFPVIFFSAWVGGRICGMVLSVVAALLVDYAFLPPVGTFSFRQNGLGEIIFIAIGFAITALINWQKVTHAKATETAERVDLALRAGKIGVFEMDLQHPEIPVKWSARQYEIFGMDPAKESLDYEMFRRRIHPDDLAAVDREFEASLREKRDFSQNYRIILDNGNSRWVEARARVFYDRKGQLTHMIGTNIDVTETVQAQETVTRALKAREEMLAIVSHDLRNPLGSILMGAAMIKRKLSSDDAFIIAQANSIQRASERMNQMIEDLLNLAKIEAGNFTITKREICGCDVVTEAVEMMSAQAQEKKIGLEISGTDQPLQMSCNHNQILRVFSNLIGNAIKFTPEQGSVKVSAEDKNNEVLFTVSDTGPGIAENHIPHVFDRFWQASDTQHMGTGLGLAISKGIVEAHGGRIWVTSRFGHGATFLFTLPKANGNKRDLIV